MRRRGRKRKEEGRREGLALIHCCYFVWAVSYNNNEERKRKKNAFGGGE